MTRNSNGGCCGRNHGVVCWTLAAGTFVPSWKIRQESPECVELVSVHTSSFSPWHISHGVCHTQLLTVSPRESAQLPLHWFPLHCFITERHMILSTVKSILAAQHCAIVRALSHSNLLGILQVLTHVTTGKTRLKKEEVSETVSDQTEVFCHKLSFIGQLLVAFPLTVCRFGSLAGMWMLRMRLLSSFFHTFPHIYLLTPNRNLVILILVIQSLKETGPTWVLYPTLPGKSNSQ